MTRSPSVQIQIQIRSGCGGHRMFEVESEVPELLLYVKRGRAHSLRYRSIDVIDIKFLVQPVDIFLSAILVYRL